MELPPVGLGTMGIDDPDTVELAIDVGYRHLGTAQVYDNEAVVGEGAAAQAHGYPLVAHSPLIGGDAFDDPVLRDIAETRDTSPAAVSIAWVLSHDNVVTIPKASSRAHLRANLDARSLDLSDDEIERIDGIDCERELYPE